VLSDHTGQVLEWRFVSTKPGVRDPFVGNLLYNEIYLDHNSRLLSGSKAANSIAHLTGCKTRAMPIDAFMPGH